MIIAADGSFGRCSHLYSKQEFYENISNYWYKSEKLKALREIYLSESPCNRCMNIEKCTPCQALFIDERDKFYYTRQDCVLYSTNNLHDKIKNENKYE